MWKDKIKNLFAHRQLPPSPDLWTRLEQQLATETRKAVPVPTKKIRWYYYAAAAAVLIAISICSLNERQVTDVSQEIVFQQQNINNVCKTNTPSSLPISNSTPPPNFNEPNNNVVKAKSQVHTPKSTSISPVATATPPIESAEPTTDPTPHNTNFSDENTHLVASLDASLLIEEELVEIVATNLNNSQPTNAPVPPTQITHLKAYLKKYLEEKYNKWLALSR